MAINQNGFSNVRGTKIYFKIDRMKAVGRYLVSNGLSYNWEVLRSAKHIPDIDSWQIVAVYDHCAHAKASALAMYSKLREALNNNYSAQYVPLTGDNEAFSPSRKCRNCENRHICEKNYNVFDRLDSS